MSGQTSTSTSSAAPSTPAQRVSDIFSQAGVAFEQLSQLTSQLSPPAGQQHQQQQHFSEDGKWTDEEVEMLRSAVTRFAEDLTVVSQRIKGRMVGQIRNTLRKKAMEDAGMGKPASLLVSQQQQQPVHQEVTLNALNVVDSSNNEVDVEGVGDSTAGEVVEEVVGTADTDGMAM